MYYFTVFTHFLLSRGYIFWRLTVLRMCLVMDTFCNMMFSLCYWQRSEIVTLLVHYTIPFSAWSSKNILIFNIHNLKKRSLMAVEYRNAHVVNAIKYCLFKMVYPPQWNSLFVSYFKYLMVVGAGGRRFPWVYVVKFYCRLWYFGSSTYVF